MLALRSAFRRVLFRVRSAGARPARVLLLLAFLLLTTSVARPHARPARDFQGLILAESGDAYAAYDAASQTWEVGSAGILRRMHLDPIRGYQPTLLVNRITGRSWLAPLPIPGDDLSLQLDGESITGAPRAARLRGTRAEVAANGGVELVVSLGYPSFTAHLHYAVFPNGSTVERWVVLENEGRTPLRGLTALDSFALALAPTANPLRLYWVQGLSPKVDNADLTQPLPTLRLRWLDLGEGAAQELGSTYRSTEDSMGWFALADPVAREGLFGGIEWSGAWRVRAERAQGITRLRGGLQGLRYDLAPGASFEGPRHFLGFYQGDLDAAANASHAFARNYLMAPHPANFPWVQFNTWYAYNISYDETELMQQVDRAAALGVELFYVDAGWYEGSPAEGDFGWGLGTWRENKEKFPSGLASFSDYVHSQGMRFGLWVEPERVDLRYVDTPDGIPADWLAPEGQALFAEFKPPEAPEAGAPFVPSPEELAPTAQICLSHPEARAWMKEWLARLVRDYQLDWLKWDYNLYMSCDPPGAAGPGNYLHVQGLYEVLDYLRAEFPNLIIENCASGGNRMDYGLIRRTHVAWVSDETEPSFRVRYLMAGASYPFPPEYLNTWLIDSGTEGLEQVQDSATLQAWVRSRMMGALGFSIRLLDEASTLTETLAAEIAEYKQVRKIVAHGELYRLLPQNDLTLPVEPPLASDAAMFYNQAEDEGVVFLFQGAIPWSRRRLSLKGLDPDRVYQVQAIDRTVVSRRTGAWLMSQGLRPRVDNNRPSLIYFIRPAPPGTSPDVAAASR